MKFIRFIHNRIIKRIKRFIKIRFFRRYTTFDFEMTVRTKLNPKFKRDRMDCCNKVYQQTLEIEKNRDKNKKVSIVFICQFNAAWNSCMSTFQAALADPDVDVTLLALPEKVMQKGVQARVSDITGEIYGDNVAYEYCKSFFPDTINAYNEEKKTWYDLEALKPDYVVFSRSNQNYLPLQYRCNVLATYTKVCHIPYAYCKMLWDSRAVYRENLSDYVYATFTENQMYRDMLRKMYFDILQAKWKRIEFFGFPRFDLHGAPVDDPAKMPKTILWLPRWVTEARLESTTFFQYKDILIDFFLKRPEYKLICRPHPKMFGNFIATGEMPEEDVHAFKKLFAETENFYLDEYSDYLPSFEVADIYISDTSSLLVEEFITGKPIIFCGKMSHFDKDAKKWAKHMYPVRNEQNLMAQLTSLLDGHDPKKALRDGYIKEEMKHDGQCGQRIINFLKADYYDHSSAQD